MKIFAQVLGILLILAVLCDGNKRPKRTLGTFLRYFGYRIIPIDDVEFVTESIPEQSTRNPKALRINTQRPSIKVEMEETTPKPRKSTTTQSIPKFNPLLPDIINSMFQINFTTMRSPMNVRNSMKKTTLKPNKEKGTEFLIRPMDIPNMMSQKLTDPMMMQPSPELPQVSDMMQPPAMQMNQQGMPMQMNGPGMQMNAQGMQMMPMNSQGMSMNQQGMPMQMIGQGMAMQGNGQEMQMNQQMMPMQMNGQGMDMQMNSQGMSDQMLSPMQNMNSTDSMMPSMEIPPSQPMDSMPNQPMNANQNPEMQAQTFQSLPGQQSQSQNLENFEMVKSQELPFQQFPGQFIIGNSIAVSDFINTRQHLPFQTQFHTQFSTPHASHFTIARSGKELKLNNYNYPVTYYH